MRSSCMRSLPVNRVLVLAVGSDAVADTVDIEFDVVDVEVAVVEEAPEATTNAAAPSRCKRSISEPSSTAVLEACRACA
jgi:hypothetical protein